MKFIRVNGRVVPIKDGKGGSSAKQKQSMMPISSKEYDKAPNKAAAKLGAIGMASALGGMFAAKKLGIYGNLGIGTAGLVAGVAATIHGIRNPWKQGKKEGFGTGVGAYVKQSLSHTAGALGVGGVAAGGYLGGKHIQKLMRASRIAKSGLKVIK